MTIATLLDTKTQEELRELAFVDLGIAGVNVRGLQKERFARGYVEIDSQRHAAYQAIREKIVKGGFLETAEDGWIELVGEGFFRLTRQPATNAIHELQFADTGSVGPKEIKEAVRVAVADDGQLFRAIESQTVPLNGTVKVQFRAENAGAAGNVLPGTINRLQTPISGITVSNPEIAGTGSSTIAAGTDKELKTAYSDRCTARWGTLAAGGNTGAFVTWIGEAFKAAGLANTITRYRVDDSNPYGQGSIGVWLANAAGAATSSEVTTVDNYMQPRKPLGSGQLVVAAASVQAEAVSGTIYADSTPNVVAKAQTALATLASTYPMGSDLYIAELIAAVMGVDGIYNFVLTSPTADVVIGINSVLSLTSSFTIG